jgi:hypothetical protein
MAHKLFPFIFLFCVTTSYATTWNVGPSRAYTFCSQVAPLVGHGDTILIDFATYYNDPQVIWNKNNLYIAGIGGRPRLEAGSIIANDMVNGKGIFVISGADVHVHNLEFANAVVQDNNGAGIRQEGPNLWISNCRFIANEMGILAGNIANCKTTIEYSAFVNGGSTFNPGYQHNIYINHIDTLVFRYNFTYDAIAEGHELKSRATHNFILYNRIANETTEDSRTIDLPNGGTSVIVGNIIEQGPLSANSNLVGFGLEGLTNPGPHVLYCTNNTFVNKKSTGSFIQVANGIDTLFVKNNLFAGARTGGLIIGSPVVLDTSHNLVNNVVSSFGFEDEVNYNYHLVSGAAAIDAGVDLTQYVFGYSLQPEFEYVDTCLFQLRIPDAMVDIGAYEYTIPLRTNESEFAYWTISPNPASASFIIHLDEVNIQNAIVWLLTMTGEVILKTPVHTGENNVDVSMLPRGIYLVMVGDAKRRSLQKVVLLNPF